MPGTIGTPATGSDWNYSGDPTTSNLDAVRHLIGDTNEDYPLLNDSEIEYELVVASNDIDNAAIGCVEALLALAAKRVTKKQGDRQINYSDGAAGYAILLARLEARANRAAMTFSVPSTIKKVRDTISTNYPTLMRETDIDRQGWGDDTE